MGAVSGSGSLPVKGEMRAMTISMETPKASGTLDEERLLVERARRDPAAFGELYERYADRVVTYAYTRTGSREDAEDIAADTFALALEGLPRYEWRNLPFGAWLFRIAANRVAMYYRRQRPSLPIHDLAIGDDDADPEREVMRASDAESVRSAVGRLKRDQQRAVVLRYEEGMRAREIAAEMGRSEGSVKLLLHRATHALRSEMLPLSA